MTIIKVVDGVSEGLEGHSQLLICVRVSVCDCDLNPDSCLQSLSILHINITVTLQ